MFMALLLSFYVCLSMDCCMHASLHLISVPSCPICDLPSSIPSLSLWVCGSEGPSSVTVLSCSQSSFSLLLSGKSQRPMGPAWEVILPSLQIWKLRLWLLVQAPSSTSSPYSSCLWGAALRRIGPGPELSTSDSSCKVRRRPGLPSRERRRNGPRGGSGISRERLVLAGVARESEEPALGASARSPPPAPEWLAARGRLRAPHSRVQRSAAPRPFGS